MEQEQPTLKRNTLKLVAVLVSAAVWAGPMIGAATAQELPKQQPQKAPAARPVSGDDAVPAAAPQGAGDNAAKADPGKGEAAKTDPGKVVLTVGNEKVTAADVEALISDLSPQQRQVLKAAGKRLLADEIVKMKLLSQEAQKRGLQNSPKIKRQLELVRDQILASSVTTDLQRQHFEQNKDQFNKVHARHILVRMAGSRAPVRPGQKELSDDEAKAKAVDLKKQLAGGADFAELARKESDDTVSGAQGGDLGEFGHGQMVPEFDKVVFSMKPGDVSDPVKTQFGYHLIQVQDVLGFESSQREVAAQTDKQVQQLMDDLKKNTKIDVDESFFGPPLPTDVKGAPGTAGGAPGAPGAAPAGQPQPQQPVRGEIPK
jgi:peptidyl-prolyl cis-trans isomerase C